MKINLKKELREAFTPPAPTGRDSFLATIPYPKLTYPEFIMSQICYIRKRVWFISLLILLSGVGTVCIVPDSGMMPVWVISALIPFLALMTAAEISRSDIFGMSEIESACRFSLPQVIGARMIILGVCNFALIAAAAAALGIFSPFGIAKSALYILTPYVLVNGISLGIFGRVRGQDGVFLSATVALAVSLAGMIFLRKEIFNERTTTVFMLVICVFGTLLMTVQLRKILTRKENSYGTQN